MTTVKILSSYFPAVLQILHTNSSELCKAVICKKNQLTFLKISGTVVKFDTSQKHT